MSLNFKIRANQDEMPREADQPNIFSSLSLFITMTTVVIQLETYLSLIAPTLALDHSQSLIFLLNAHCRYFLLGLKIHLTEH